MKKNLLLFSALAAMVFTGCQSDEPAVNGEQGNIDGDKYMAFTISNLSGGGRAISDTPAEYEPAEGNEGGVLASDLYFLFFDRNGAAFTMEGRNVNGTVTNTNMVVPAGDIEKKVDANGNETLTGTLVLGKPGSAFVGSTPVSVLVIANPNTDAMSNLANQSLSNVLKVTTSYSGGWTSASKFLMTNASYESGGKQVTAVDIADYIKDTPGEATAEPAVINLERAVAKIRVTYAASYDVINTDVPATATDAEKKQFTIRDGNAATGESTVNLKAQVDGWRLINWTNECYGFKNLSVDDYKEWNWAWNDETNKRSYWAYSSASANDDFNNLTYDLKATDQFLNKSFSAVTPTENVVYCYEHTRGTADKVTSRPALNYASSTAPTAICVKVEIGMEKDGAFAPLNMVKWAGKLYTVEHFNKVVLDTYMSANPTADRTQLSVNFVVDDANKNTWKASVHNNANNTDTGMPTYTNFLWWENGVTSYWMNIEHFGGLFGVVRNHIYDYNITAVNGLGVPGNNPDIPTEKQSYLAAALRILNWRIVSHDVTLE